MLRLCMSVAALIAAGMMATHASADPEFKGEVFKGDVLFGLDNTSFADFLDTNTLKFVYLDVSVGHSVHGEEGGRLTEECEKYHNSAGEQVEHLQEANGYTYIALTGRVLGELGCGDLLELDLRKAAVGPGGGGTGIFLFPVRGLFQVSRPGQWNALQRSFRLLGIEASYEVLQAAQAKADALPAQ